MHCRAEHRCRSLGGSQTTAKQRYFVTDNDLKKLGSLRKANPHKKDWQQMHLYLQSQAGALRCFTSHRLALGAASCALA